jgi:succinate dehydrogenase flavin-adding protein (antitoxin of CptAB toxin-antitoxin module)
MLKELVVEDPKYLKWLKQRFEKEEKELSPTMKAILKFCQSV